MIFSVREDAVSWKYIIVCNLNKVKCDECLIQLEIKINISQSIKKARKEERNIVKDMIKDIKKYYENESNSYDNRDVLGCREMFIGFVVKYWFIQR